MGLGSLAPLNGFLPFSGDPNNPWNQNIANAPVDPNSSAIIAGIGVNTALHPDFSPDEGIPYVVVDSSQTPPVAISTPVAGPPGPNSNQGDSVVEPVPSDAPIEGNYADCVGWPNYYPFGDSHMLVIDRNQCWLYETYLTQRCNGVFAAQTQSLWDLKNGNQRPWGWTSSDAAGLPVFVGLAKYDEATNGIPNPANPNAAGFIQHALRFTLAHTKGDNDSGYFVMPATHGAASASSYQYLNVMGMRLRLKSDAATQAKIATYSPINQSLLTAMQQYGLILADNGSNMFVSGVPDPRWNTTDLGFMHGGPHPILASDFEVIQMPAGEEDTNPVPSMTSPSQQYSYMNYASAPYTVADVEAGLYPGGNGPEGTALSGGGKYEVNGVDTAGATPTINSFTANGSSSGALTVAPGASVTFAMSVSGDTYDYIDNAGPVRLTTNGGGAGINTGTLTITPLASQTYTLNSVNSHGISQSGQAYAYSLDPSAPIGNAPPSITVTVSGSQLPVPILTPVGGTYNQVQHVVVSVPNYPQAQIYYTVDQSIPTYPPTGTTTLYTAPVLIANSSTSSACGPAYSVQCNYLQGEAVNVIAVIPGIGTTPVGGDMYIVNSQAVTPTFSPAAGTYTSTQTVTISDTQLGVNYSYSSNKATIYYTTDGSTPAVATNPDGSVTSTPLLGTTMKYTAPFTVSSTTTVNAIAANAKGYSTSAVATAIYTLPQTFSLAFAQPTVTIGPGETGMFSNILTATAQNGFSGAISFACSGLPSGYQCVFAPSTLTPTASGATTALSFTVNSTSASARHSSPLFPGATLAIGLCFFGLKKRRRLQLLLLSVVGIVGLGVFAGCGGGTTTSFNGSPVTSTVTVTGTAGSVQNTATFTLITFTK